jgi:hypothetical protein
LKTSNKQKLGIALLQVFLILGSVFLLYSKLNDGEIVAGLASISATIRIWHVLVLVFLSAAFWLLDTTVWQTVMKPFSKISFFRALRYNMVAQSAGILTPLLVGDYGLRSMLLKNDIDPRQNTLVTMAYQLVKVMTRVVIGIAAAVVLSAKLVWGWLLLLLAAALLVLGGFTVKQFIKAIGKSKYTQRLWGMGDRLDFSQLNMLRTLLPAILLFLGFSMQTALLIFWLDDATSLFQVLLWVILTYSITSFLPPLSFFDPLAKSAFGALIGSQFASADAILMAFTLTWVLNRGVPALLSGLLFKKLARGVQNTSSSTK